MSGQKIHERYGGVVPELASRAHQGNILPVIDSALEIAGVKKEMLDAIAFTQGPGLLGSLLVGVSFAKGFALALDKPLIAIDHLSAHLAAHFITGPTPKFPFLCLLVSGGHTLLVKMESVTRHEIIGRTTDDAAGEAFDKAAKVLGLPYPGGPLIDKYGAGGNPYAYPFPEPSIPGLDFSFSGLKTSFLYFIRDNVAREADFIQNHLPDICASYQRRIVEYLLHRLEKASEEYNISEIGIAGGVAANSYLRKKLQEKAMEKNWNIHIPAFEYCTDNAAMVAMAAHFKYLDKDFAGQDVAAYARGL